MRAGVIHITLRRSGREARREEEISASPLTIGRGTNNALTLRDLAVSVEHALLHGRSDGVYVEAVGTSEVRVNGSRISGEARIGPGDTLRIGPYALRVVEPAAGRQLQMEVEEVDRRGSEHEELRQRTRSGVEVSWFTRRKLSWLTVIGILVVYFAIPLTSGQQGSWNSGSISNKHAFIANECAVCHTKSFEAVRDDGCLSCHANIERHTRPEISVASLEQTRCATCHVEHNGNRGLAALDQPLCEGCHSDLSNSHAQTTLADVSDFRREHPEFRLRLVTQPGTGASELVERTAGLAERSGLLFSHLRHVGQALALPEGGEGHLQCDRCHELDAAEKYIQPVVFESHCQECHSLTFDAAFGKRQALHGDAARMREDLRGAYSEKALKGEVKSPAAPRALRFLRPGQELTSQEASIVFSWVEQQVERAERHLFDIPGECARCHNVDSGVAWDGGIGVSPVEIAAVWMPKSEFHHGTHAPFACRECHAAASVHDPSDSAGGQRPEWSLPGAGPYSAFTPQELEARHGLKPSTSASDVLVPGIETCRSCHGGAYDSPPLVASECVMCHRFHRTEHGPMKQRVELTASSLPDRT